MFGQDCAKIVNTVIHNVRGGVSQMSFYGWDNDQKQQAVRTIKEKALKSRTEHVVVRGPNAIAFEAIEYTDPTGVDGIFLFDVSKYTHKIVVYNADSPTQHATVGKATIVAKSKDGVHYLVRK